MSFSLKITNGFKVKRIFYFSDFAFDLKYDAIANGFSFAFFFDPFNDDHKEIAAVGKYQKVEVIYNDEVLLTGNILNINFTHNSKAELVTISGHSKTGILTRCQIPISLYPLQSNNLSLRQIASKLINPFGIEMIVDSEIASKMDKKYKTAIANQGQTIADYLVSLAKQRDVVITHNELGNLLFTEANLNGTALLDFDSKNPNLKATNFNLSFKGEGMHSQISVMRQASSSGGNAGQKTISNPFVPKSYFSPKVTTQTAGNDNDTLPATKRALASELQNIKLSINTASWDINGKILKPNNTITIKNPNLFLYEKTVFFIESISYIGNNSETTATLNCVLPEVYNGNTPKNIFE